MNEPTKEQLKKFNPEKDNPCWDCEYRKQGERDYINICLQDESEPCIKELDHE
jgi:hypothetical protein